MSTSTDELAELYVSVTGAEGVTESQAEEPSRDPVEGEAARLEAEVSELARTDGLDGAVEGAETGGDTAVGTG